MTAGQVLDMLHERGIPGRVAHGTVMGLVGREWTQVPMGRRELLVWLTQGQIPGSEENPIGRYGK